MKASELVSELRGKSPVELREELEQLRHERFKLRMQGRTGQSFKHDQVRKNRRDIARVCTVINETSRAAARTEEEA